MTTLRLIRLAAALTMAAALAGCSLFGDDDDDFSLEDMPPGDIFQMGEAQLADGRATDAAQTFNEIERLYPFSQLAKRAIIMSAFSSYTAGDFASARTTARRYLDLYPSDIDAPYAQHMIALSYYDNIVDVGRDQGTTRKALKALREVVSRYPESDFARDAQLKIDLTLDHLAGKEMTVGRYYLKRGHYSAAINRFRIVIDKYQTTSQTPEALHRMVEANLALGLENEALASAAVLGHNYPGSDWYANSYALITGRNLLPEGEDHDSFFDRVYRRVIQGKWL
jgi:outer membrane protein assembly factor BamD